MSKNKPQSQKRKRGKSDEVEVEKNPPVVKRNRRTASQANGPLGVLKTRNTAKAQAKGRGKKFQGNKKQEKENVV